MAVIQLGDHTLQLLAEKAVWCAETGTLFIADVHLGKTATFRREGIPLPEGGTDHDLRRLTDLIERHRPRQLIVLGDLIHARQGVDGHVTESFGAWRAQWASLNVLLIRGNHDRRLHNWPARWQLRIEAEPFAWHGLDLRHFPVKEAAAERPWLAGHLHPSVRVRLGGRESISAPAYYFLGNGLILPAFGSFTGMARARASEAERFFAVVGESVLEIPARLCRT
ncbi:MAG: ligase-associated DNA damage response endonuclease PdeM [Opitutales bacterium]